MHHRITTTFRHLRQDLAERLDERTVHDACRQAGHAWRPCLLTPVAILHWFLIQVLNGNTALAHVSLQAGRSFTDAAFCLARGLQGVTGFRGSDLVFGLAPRKPGRAPVPLTPGVREEPGRLHVIL